MAISKVILNGEVQMDVTSDTVTAGSMLSGTTATKNDGTKATGTIASKSSSDLTASGATVTAPAGYYSANASKSVTTMTLPTTTSTSATSGYTSKATLDRSTSDRYLNIAPGYNSAGGYYKISKVANGSVTAPSSISGTSATVSTGTNTLTLTKSVSVTPNVTTAGYISSGTAGSSSVSLTASVTTKAAATITPSTSAQSIAAGTYLTGKQTISAMPSGTAGTPTASKGSVSNHTISVTPSVTNTTGYITGGTKTGTAVSVSASELVSGTKSITENGTGIDVTNYASVDVNVQKKYTATIMTDGIKDDIWPKYNLVEYNLNRYYTAGDSFEFSAGETMSIHITPSMQPAQVSVILDGTVIYSANVNYMDYDFTLPNNDINISLCTPTSNDVTIDSVVGGASNFIQGTFTAGTAGTVQTINVPYTGSGYPIALAISVEGGTYVNGSGNANAQTWYDVIHQYAIGYYSMSKCGVTNSPQYVGKNVFIDGATVMNAYKNSTSNNNSYSRNFNIGALIYKTGEPGTSSTDIVTVSTNTTINVRIAGESSGYGFLSGLIYSYYVVYSE